MAWLIVILVFGIIIGNLMLLKHSAKFKPPANIGAPKTTKDEDSKPREK
jgi:hypothetical protein